jgi:hypothetical protein
MSATPPVPTSPRHPFSRLRTPVAVACAAGMAVTALTGSASAQAPSGRTSTAAAVVKIDRAAAALPAFSTTGSICPTLRWSTR